MAEQTRSLEDAVTQPVAPTNGPQAAPAKPGDPNTGTQVGPTTDDADDIDVDAEELDPRVKQALSKKNREAQNLRARLKDAEPLLAEYAKWKESQKTEEQRRIEAAEAQMFELATAREELARQRACLKAGFTAEEILELGPRLRGEDEEALVEDAKRLKAMIAPASGARRADPSQGRGTPASSSPAALFGQLLSKEK